MKKLWMLFAVLVAGTLSVFAQDDIKLATSCKYCGMDREKFSHSRMLIQYDDGTTAATCSLHCAAVDPALTIDKTRAAIKVADFGTKKPVDAEKAVWVVGGSKPGVMTRRPKWAVENKADVDAFIRENGSARASFEEAVKLAYEDIYQDTKMIREKRKMKMTEQMKGAKEHGAQ